MAADFFIQIVPIPEPKLFSADFGDEKSIRWQWEVRGVDSTVKDFSADRALAYGVRPTKEMAQRAAESWADALGDKMNYFYTPKAE